MPIGYSRAFSNTNLSEITFKLAFDKQQDIFYKVEFVVV